MSATTCSIDSTPKPLGIEADAGSIRAGLLCPAPDGFRRSSSTTCFATNEAMNAVYTQAVVGETGSQPVRSVDRNCPSDDGPGDLAGHDVGRVGCYYTTQQLDGDRPTDHGRGIPRPHLDVRRPEHRLAVASLKAGNDDAATLQNLVARQGRPRPRPLTRSAVSSPRRRVRSSFSASSSPTSPP